MQETQIIRNYLIPLKDINLKIPGALEALIKLNSDNLEDYTFRSISTSVVDDNLLVVVVFDI